MSNKRFKRVYHDARLTDVRLRNAGAEVVFQFDLCSSSIGGGGSATVVLGRVADVGAASTAIEKLRSSPMPDGCLDEVAGVTYDPEAPPGWKRVIFDWSRLGPVTIDCKDVIEL